MNKKCFWRIDLKYMYKLIGKRLDGRYEFLELIGVGGMADVYRARDNVKNCDVAIKVLKEEFSKNREFVNRFKNESKANASLSHPNIVRIFDVDFGDKIRYIVMEYIDGVTLKEFIEKVKVLNWKDVVHFTFQILRALQHAHDKGIVHRDMKPQNIMLLEDGTIKIMDFGIARFARDEKVSYGKAIGSVHYISPEQASGGVTDAKSDLYSVGIMMYEMLTGKLPFEGKTPELVAVKQIQSYAKSPLALNPKIPQGLVDIIVRAMQKSPEKRYQSANEMLCDIDEFKKNPDILFEYKYLNDEGNTQYFTLSEKENMKHFSNDFPVNGGFFRGGSFSSDFYGGAGGVMGGLKKKEKLIPILLGIASGVFLVALIIIGVFVFGRGGKSGFDEVELPNFVGSSYDDVKRLIKEKYDGLRLVVSYEDDKNYEKDIVCDQKPEPGVHVKRNGEVKLSISKGDKVRRSSGERVSVPDVYGKDFLDAQRILKNEGFTNLKLIQRASDEVVEGKVIATDPGADDVVSLSREIKIYYSSGVNSENLENGKRGSVNQVIIPNFAGKSVDEARNELKKIGFDVEIIEKYDSGGKEGKVISQSSEGNVSLDPNSNKKIALVVGSGGKKPENNKRQEGEQIERQVTFPLRSDRPIGDTFDVIVTDPSGKVVSQGKYSIGGTFNFTAKGYRDSNPVVYSVRVKNTSTGKVANYGTIGVNFSSETGSAVFPKLDARAFSQTLNSSGSSGSKENQLNGQRDQQQFGGLS